MIGRSRRLLIRKMKGKRIDDWCEGVFNGQRPWIAPNKDQDGLDWDVITNVTDELQTTSSQLTGWSAGPGP